MDGAPPEFLKVDSPVEVFEGSAAKLGCRVRGTPSPDIKWLKDGESVEVSRRITSDYDGKDATLHFIKTALDDEGDYKCMAENEFGSASCTVELLVNEVQTKPTFVKRLKDANVLEGDSVAFTVQVQGNPEPVVQWFAVDREISTGGRFVLDSTGDGQYTVTVSECEMKDKGRYKCVASNEVGTSVCSAALTVKEKLIAPQFLDQASQVPMQIDDGGDVTLQVEVKGKPEPSIKWHKDEKPINRTSSKYKTEAGGGKHTLTIIAATPDDSGVYQCTATNPAGTTTRTFNVNIDGESLPLYW